VDVARRRAMKDLGDIVQGKDPREERRAIRASDTLQAVFDQYQEDHTKERCTAKTIRTDKSRFDTCFADWKARKVATIRESDVRSKHTSIGKERGHRTANAAVQLLRRMLNFARISPNPAGNKAVNFFPEIKRDRFLQPEEIPRFFAAVAQEPNPTLRDFFHLALLTGARRSNVESMRWDEIGLESSTWTIPGTKTKNKEAMPVHLVDEAKKILKRREEDAEAKIKDGDPRYGEWVFPSKRFDAKTPHLVEPKAAWARILKRANIKDLILN
jgi:integrase